MIYFLKKLFTSSEELKLEKEKNDFSEFFIEFDSQKKAKIIRQVLREANEEQKRVLEVYKRKLETIP